MATNKKALHEEIRRRYMETVKQFLTEKGEEVLERCKCQKEEPAAEEK